MPANVLAPSGFATSRQFIGGVPNFGMRVFPIAYNYTGASIAYGDPVKLFTDGTVRLYAKADTTILGIFRGCKYLDPSSGRIQWFSAWTAPTLPATTVVEAEIDCDPGQTFQCQMRGTALTQSSVGRNVDIFLATSGVPTPQPAGQSVCALDGTAAITATLPFRLMRLIPAPANGAPFSYNETYDNQIWEVALNTSNFPAGTRTGQA